MSIPFHPRMGQVLVGDFSDLKAPEINKIRPVIVISPKLAHRSGLVAIVPISLTAPVQEFAHCHKLSRNYHPLEADDIPSWAKCDLVMNVAIRRLRGFKVGRRKWEIPNLSAQDLEAVRFAVMRGLGFDRLKISPDSAM